MCVFLVCVLVLFRASVCAFRVSELLVVRLSFVVKLFRLRSWFRSFRVEFWSRFSNSISRILEVAFWSRISNSSFSFRRSIRFLEFQFSIRVSNSSSLIFRFEFFVEIFDVLLNSTSRISIRICRRKFRCSIRLLECRRSSRFLEVRVHDSSPLNFEFVLIYSTSRISIRICRRNLSSKFVLLDPNSSFEFSIELFNFRLSCSICAAIASWRSSLFSHSSTRLLSCCHASFARAFRA